MRKGPKVGSWDALDDEAVELMAGAERAFEAERRRLYRAYFDAFVRHASPLLVDMARAWALPVGAALRSMRPPAGWPVRWRAHMKTPPPSGLDLTRRDNLAYLFGPHRPPGRLTVAHGREERYRVSLHVEDGALQPAASLGEAACYGGAGSIQVWVPWVVPETVATAVVGRPLAEVVHHPLLERRPYPILRVLCGIVDHTVFEAEAPRVPIPVGWRASR